MVLFDSDSSLVDSFARWDTNLKMMKTANEHEGEGIGKSQPVRAHPVYDSPNVD